MEAQIGSISHGTCRSEDLLRTFVDQLRELAEEETEQTDVVKQHLDLCEEIDGCLMGIMALSEAGFDDLVEQFWSSEIVSNWVNESLPDALDVYAPPHCYFGTNEGDGSDYGFWIDTEELRNFAGLRIACAADIPKDYAGEALITRTDGEMTLFKVDNGKVDQIW